MTDLEIQFILTLIIIFQGIGLWMRGDYIDELKKRLDFWEEKYGNQEEEEEEDEEDEDENN